MSIPNNPIDTPHVNSHSGVIHADDANFQDYQVELRIQEAFLKWLLIYFSGASFDTVDPDTQVVTARTFERCDCMVGEGSIPDALQRPLIHAVPMDDRDVLVGKRGKIKKYTKTIRWNIFIRGANSLEGSDPKYRGKHLIGLVSEQMKWLFQGVEKQGLAHRGIKRSDIVRGPVPVQNAHYLIRQFVITMEADYHVIHNL